jgi:hypothetical protein
MKFESASAYLRALEKDPGLAALPMQLAANSHGVTRAAIDRMVKLRQLEEIRIGKSRLVKAWSLIERDRKHREKVVAVRRYLEARAREGQKFVFYEPVMELVGLRPTVPADRAAIGGILGEVSDQTRKESDVLLTVLVHRKSAGRTRPGIGFKKLASTLGYRFDDYDDFLERQTQKVLRHYRRGQQTITK